MNYHVGDVRPLAPDALLDLARARVRLGEACCRRRGRASGTRPGRRPCAGTAARAASLPVASSTIRRTTAAASASTSRAVSRLGERLEMRLHALRSPARPRGSPPRPARRSSCASSSESVARQLHVQRQLRAAVDVDEREVVHLAHARHGERRGVGALAQRRILDRLDVDDDVGARAAPARPPPRPRRPRRGPARRPTTASTPITTSANWRPAGLAHAEPAQLDGRHAARRSPRAPPPPPRRARGPSARRRSRLISRAAASSTSTPTKSAAIGSPSGWPVAREARARRARRPSPARSLPKCSAFAASAGLSYRRDGPPRDDRPRRVDRQITTPRTANAYQAACTCACVDAGEPLDRARYEMKTLASDEERRPRRAPRDARPCRGRTGASTSAGRAATRTAKNVSSAATRSVPEWTASETRPRLCVARPTRSLSTRSVAAAATETSAARRCGVMWLRGAARGCRGAPARARSPRTAP